MALLAAALANGCYLSHELPVDGGREEAATAACESEPLGEVESFHAVVLAVSPPDCSRAGHAFERRGVVLVAARLEEHGCRGQIAREACGVDIDYACWIPDVDFQYVGHLTSEPSFVTVVITGTLTGRRCERVERWTRVAE